LGARLVASVLQLPECSGRSFPGFGVLLAAGVFGGGFGGLDFLGVGFIPGSQCGVASLDLLLRVCLLLVGEFAFADKLVQEALLGFPSPASPSVAVLGGQCSTGQPRQNYRKY